MNGDVISCVICISSEVEYVEKKELKKFYQGSYICRFKRSLQCNEK